MLLLSKSVTLEGITVFGDHADPSQFWYLPGPVTLARRREDKRAAFTFIKYKPAVVAAGVSGGGFLTFEVNLRLDADLERRILSKLSSISKGRPKLSVVPFDEGTVQCIALNIQGAGGTNATAARPGTFNAVEQILGASVPALYGDNSASFSLTLSQEGAIILEKAFDEGTTPVGVIYNLTFTGMRPALDVKITADYKRIYDHFTAGLSAQVYFAQIGIDAGFEKLVQDGAIKIEVINFTGDDDLKEKEKWALDFFKDSLLRDWFQPTLTPGQLAGGMAQPEPLDNVIRRGNEMRPPATPAPPRPPATPPAPPVRPVLSPTAGTGQGAEPAGINPRPPAVPAGADPASVSPTAGTGGPTAPSPTPGAAAAGVQPASSIPGGLPAGLGSSTGAPFAVSFKLKFVRQEELKTVSLSYKVSEAVQRIYAPQGFFGLLVADLEKSGHFVEVDLDAPFFRVFEVAIDAPFDFAKIGLQSAHVAIDYGNPTEAENHKHKDFVFDRADQAEKSFQAFMNANRDTRYTYRVEYNFDPQSEWQGKAFSYSISQTTEDRTLLLNPFNEIGFLEIEVFPDQLEPELVDSVDVVLRYEEPEGTKQEKTLLVKPNSQPQFWKLRLSDRTARSYSYFFVYHLKNGSDRQTMPVTTQATAIPVISPFEDALELEFLPLFDPSTIKTVFIDIVYDDADNDYKVEERLKLVPDPSADSIQFRIPLMNPDLRSFQYRLTFVGKDNKLRRGPFITETETLISVSE